MSQVRRALPLLVALFLFAIAVPSGAVGGDPTTPQEQQFIYDLNQMRWNPLAHDIEHLLSAPRYPVAINGDLASAAHFKAQEMIDLGYFDHESPTGQWPNGLARAYGFDLPEAWVSDNNYIEASWSSSGYGFFPGPDVFVLSSTQWYPDITLSRPDLFYQFAREVGLGYAEGNGNGSRLVYFSSPRDGQEPNGYDHSRWCPEWCGYIDQNQIPPYFITGVVFDDTNGNGRMDLGEGQSGATVSAGGTNTTTNAGGGYSILVDLPCATAENPCTTASGWLPVDLTVSSPGAGSTSVTVSTENVGVDFVVGRSDAIAHQPGATSERWSGADRYSTAVAVSQNTYPSGANVVYLAVGTNFPDAIAAGPAAGVENAPILLTQKTNLPAVTSAELTRLDPSKVVIVGGDAAVAASVETAVESLLPGASVVRRAGPTRFETAVEISAGAFGPSTSTVYIATGFQYADAVIAAPAAVEDGGPLLLVTPDAIPSAVSQELDRLNPSKIVIVGGTGSVGSGVEAALSSYASTVTRISGPDRYAVSAALSAATFDAPVEVVYIAVGNNFPDALAGGAATAVVGGPILLVQSADIPASIGAELLRLAPHRVVILGGAAVIPSIIASELSQYIA